MPQWLKSTFFSCYPERQFFSSEGKIFINANFSPLWSNLVTTFIYCTFFQFLSYGAMVSSQLAIILVMFVESSSSPFPVIRSKRSGVLNTYSGAILTLIFFPPNFEFWTYLTMQMQLQHCMMATRRYYSDNIYSLPKEKTLKIWCCTIT